MNLGTFSYHEVIELAINIERRGYELYTKASKMAKQEPAKNILLFLAEQEQMHEKGFRKVYEDLKKQDSNGSTTLSEESLAYLGALSDASVFPINDDQFLEQIKTLNDVIEVATQAEKDSILFYVELSIYAPDKETEEFYNLIIREEKNHLIKVQELDKLIKERGIVY